MAPVLAVGRTGFFYPRSPCGERHTWTRGSRVTYVFSIHALLAESDWLRCWQLAARDFSIHALLAESDPALSQSSAKSTPFSIHALLAESDQRGSADDMCQNDFLSTLSLRRATTNTRQGQQKQRVFYPRSPCGERPNAVDQILPGHFSIHALLAESDAFIHSKHSKFWSFLSTLSLRRATHQTQT